MRNLILLFTLVIGLVACGGDDNCTPETIAGTYTGANECQDPGVDGLEVPANSQITFTVSHIGGNDYSAINQDGDETRFTVNGCNIDIPIVEIEFFGIMIAVDGDGSIDGDQMKLNIKTNVDGDSFTCNYVGTKQ